MTKKPTYEMLEKRVKELEKEAIRLKETEKALRMNENRLRRLIEHSNDAFIVCDYDDGKILDVNQHACDSLGYTYDEILKMSVSDIDPSFYQEKRKKGKPGVPVTFEGVHRRKDGTTFPVEIRMSVFDSNGQKQILGIIRDISERKQIEEELRESEEKYRSFFEHLAFGTVLIDVDTHKVVMFNKKAYEELGYTREEYLNLQPEDIVFHHKSELIQKRFQKVIEKGSLVFETKFLKKSGELRDYLASSVYLPIRGKSYVQNIRIDITESKRLQEDSLKARNEMESEVRKRTAELEQANLRLKQEVLEREKAEEILRLSEEKFSKAFHSSPGLMLISTMEEGRFIDANERFTRTTGYTREEVIGHTSDELRLFVDPGDHGKILKMLNERGTVRDFEYEMRVKSGEFRKGSFSAELIDIDGHNCILSMVDDITERKQTEAALKESEERYRDLFEKSPVATSLTTRDGNLVACNNAMSSMVGYSIQELKNLDLFRLYVNPEDRKELFDTVNRDGLVVNFPVRLKSKEGRLIDVLLTTLKVNQASGKELYQTIGIDVTERTQVEREKKNLETRLHQARRMDAIATLAGGIAHQFNNSLSAIIGNLELLRMDFPGNETIIEYVEPMKGSIFRMKNLTDQLLAYARGGKYQPKNFLLSDFVRDTLPLIKHTIQPFINIETDLPDDVASVNADMTQMQMVMSAIISNSSEAIEEKGRIRIACKNVFITDENRKNFSGLNPGHYVSLSIEDNGKGMDQKTLRRVFEPFFSTKFHGRGLEMAAVYGIIKNHEGWISITSKMNGGTKATIYLPAVEAPVKEKKAPGNELIRGKGTILVIEDEETVMHVTHAMLERLGYNVLKAYTGAEAHSAVEKHNGEIDLVLLDIMLPDMDGKAIYTSLKKIRPDVKVIVCSGYSADGPAREILDAGAQAFIQKPFSIITLSDSLKTVLA